MLKKLIEIYLNEITFLEVLLGYDKWYTSNIQIAVINLKNLQIFMFSTIFFSTL